MSRRAASVLAHELESIQWMDYNGLYTWHDHMLVRLIDLLIIWEQIQLGVGIRDYITESLDSTVELFTPKGHNPQDTIKNNQSNQSSIIDQEYDNEDKQETK